MYDRLDRSFMLLKASSVMLLKHRGLLVFPLLSFVALVFLLISFALPAGGVRALNALSRHHELPTFAQDMVVFLMYFGQYFVIFFFNTALVGAVMMQIDGEQPTVGDGLRIAVSRFYAIFAYAFIAATVGMLLHAIQERLGFVGRLIVGLLGVGWTLATYLVVPVLAWRDCGPIEAVSESADLFKRTWGESAIGQGGLGAAFAFILILVVGTGAILISIAAHVLHSTWLMITIEIVVIAAVILTSLVHATLSGIFKVALFRYASGFSALPGFEPDVLEQAFQPAN